MPAPSKPLPGACESLDAARLAAELVQLRRQVVQLQRISSLGVLAGSIVHELNNALTPILNYAKLGLRSQDPAFRTKAFEKILEGAERASAVANGVLGLVRPRADRLEPADLARLAEDVVRLTAKDLEKHRIQLDLVIHDRPSVLVHAAQIQQVLLNLLINARQAMPEGGRITLEAGRDPTGRWAEIRVRDTGPGISPAHLRRIFEPFFTTKAPDPNGLGGTGLGLPVCREIVEAHKGRLRVESRPGQGATFTLRLPVAPAATASRSPTR
ncbi:MAG: two-component sensor histidine kinase [Isosphaeraceae bacterium]|jgi:signal transduction histidine kinase|nr:MAG: two-component sensor histidine kinase [Isosphaeraceae bacterium]